MPLATNSTEQTPTPPPPPAQAPQLPAVSVEVAPAPAKAPPQRKPLDQYKVLLHNDDKNEVLFVVRTIVEIVHVPTPQAMKVTMEAHTSGVALVAVTHMELAELLRDQFLSKGLTATIEKA